MSNRTSSIALLMVFLFAFLMLAPTATRAGSTPTGDHKSPIQIVRSDQNGIEFELSVPEIAVSASGQVRAAGLAETLRQPGAPQLPYYSTLIALPPEAEVQVTVEEVGATTGALAAPLTLAPVPEAPIEAQAQTWADAPEPLPLKQTAYYPEQPYTLSEPQYYRDLRFVRLDLYPLRYRPQNNTLSHAPQVNVSLTFSGARQEALRPLASAEETADFFGDSLLNAEQAAGWRGLPASMEAAATKLPVGTDVYKIQVNADGIYKVSYADLQAKGMAVNSVNPHTFEMLYRGEPAAYQFVGDEDNQFEAGEYVRFYGWAFDGPQAEKQFVTDNVFWLWVGGTPTLVQDAPAATGTPPTITSFRDTVTEEPELVFNYTYTDDWEDWGIEPDAWYWKSWAYSGSVITGTHPVTLIDPVDAGPDASVTAGFFPQTTDSRLFTFDHTISVNINSSASPQETTWTGPQPAEVSASVPASTLTDGENQVTTVLKSAGTISRLTYLLNRITVEYERQLRAHNNQLIFSATGPHTYPVAGFTENTDAIVWDITDRLQPARVPLSQITRSGNNPYINSFASDNPAATFIALTPSQQAAPLSISRYLPPQLDPVGGADWVAISHGDFIAETEVLAGHRAGYSGLKTQVVNLEDVVAQYGYGLPLPEAVRNYLAHALAHWQVAPRYVVMVGDTTINPRGLDCPSCRWPDPLEKRYSLTDLQFVDRWQGVVPTDHTFVLLSGDDLVPDMAIGRLTVRSKEDTANVVEKIIQYEENVLASEQWLRHILFVSDYDGSQPFYQTNLRVGQVLTGSSDIFLQHHLGLKVNFDSADAQRGRLFELINGLDTGQAPGGISILNYRGHGSVNQWGYSPTDVILSTRSDNSHLHMWNNPGAPVVLLSMDCLDGNFAIPGMPALSETFLTMPTYGTAAHWSSTGLGYTDEHEVLHTAFYQALLEHNFTAIGDAITYSKLIYSQLPSYSYSPSELYTFVLQGDPAMQIMRPDLSLEQSANRLRVEPGDTVNFTVKLANDGLLPARPMVESTLAPGLTYVEHSSAADVTMSAQGNRLSFQLNESLDMGEQVTLIVVARVADDFNGSLLTNQSRAFIGNGLDINSANNEVVTTLLSAGDTMSVHLPMITR